ncbi:hypothetical protein [Rhodoferax sp. GW822-FHT02A01]|uniref:hypothetical protein n=1 Tax=Rhodoferax sp. GW822-FHT02A01 TaxID=3141537 RepID=UPI00315D0F4E
MNPIDWLCVHAPGFAELPSEDRQAIFHFSLLWSLFEARALRTRGSASAILAITQEWASHGQLTLAPFEVSLAYFRTRYIASGQPTRLLEGLTLRNNDSPALVLSVLKGENTNAADAVGALLIIVFRLRNNLFHGVKWAYGIRGQRENFNHANAMLMSVLETQGYL